MHWSKTEIIKWVTASQEGSIQSCHFKSQFAPSIHTNTLFWQLQLVLTTVSSIKVLPHKRHTGFKPLKLKKKMFDHFLKIPKKKKRTHSNKNKYKLYLTNNEINQQETAWNKCMYVYVALNCSQHTWTGKHNVFPWRWWSLKSQTLVLNSALNLENSNLSHFLKPYHDTYSCNSQWR